MALKTHRWTRADLERLPDDGNRYEVIDGGLFVVPPPSIRHERLHLALAERLRSFVRQHDLGDIYNGRACLVIGDSQVEPDLIVSKTPLPLPAKWDDMPLPSLVVEVLSDSTAQHDRITKRNLYLRGRVPDYWIVDGDTRTVHVITPSGERTESDVVHWKPEGATSALHIELRPLFDEALGDRTG